MEKSVQPIHLEVMFVLQFRIILRLTQREPRKVICTKKSTFHTRLQRNASFSIRDNFDADSNVTEENECHKEKNLSYKNSTDEGRMISIKPVS
jgi:hypothetical protein